MKKFLCLFLCFLLLFCSACKKEEIPESPNTDDSPTSAQEFVPEISADSFYTYDGDTHNIYVNVALTTKKLTAPVTELSFELKNDTDYFVLFKEETSKGYTWEKWEDGKWKAFTKYTGTGMNNLEEISKHDELPPHTTATRTENFIIPLEAGVYRLRKVYRLTNEKVRKPLLIGAPGIECVAETYFSVLPAPQG